MSCQKVGCHRCGSGRKSCHQPGCEHKSLGRLRTGLCRYHWNEYVWGKAWADKCESDAAKGAR